MIRLIHRHRIMPRLRRAGCRNGITHRTAGTPFVGASNDGFRPGLPFIRCQREDQARTLFTFTLGHVARGHDGAECGGNRSFVLVHCTERFSYIIARADISAGRRIERAHVQIDDAVCSVPRRIFLVHAAVQSSHARYEAVDRNARDHLAPGRPAIGRNRDAGAAGLGFSLQHTSGSEQRTAKIHGVVGRNRHPRRITAPQFRFAVAAGCAQNIHHVPVLKSLSAILGNGNMTFGDTIFFQRIGVDRQVVSTPGYGDEIRIGPAHCHLRKHRSEVFRVLADVRQYNTRRGSRLGRRLRETADQSSQCPAGNEWHDMQSTSCHRNLPGLKK